MIRKHINMLLGLYIVFCLTTFLLTRSGEIKWWLVAFVAAGCHFASGFKTIGEQEKGALIWFGRILGELHSGLVFAPWPFRIRRVTKNSIQIEFGTIDDKELEQRAARSDDSISWFVMREPIRINWGDIKTTSGVTPQEIEMYRNDPYAQRLTTDPHLYFRIKVCDFPRLIDRVGGLEEAIERIKDTCVRALSEQAGKTFVARAVKEIDELSANILKRVEDLVGDPDAIRLRGVDANQSWGIDVEEVGIKDLGTPKRTNEAVADLAKAIAVADGEARAAIRKAEGEEAAAVKQAAATVTLAEADRKKTKLAGKGQAAAIRAITKASDSDTGRLILRLDAFKEGMRYGKTVIVPTNMADITGAFLSVKETLEATGGTPPPPPPPPSK